MVYFDQNKEVGHLYTACVCAITIIDMGPHHGTTRICVFTNARVTLPE